MKRALMAALAASLLSLSGGAVAQPAGGPPPSGPPPGGLPPGFPGGPPAKPKPVVPVPRTASGKPNFDGVWSHSFFYPGDKVFYALGPMPDVSMLQPWAQAEYKRHYDGMKNGKQLLISSMLCQPAGSPNFMMEAHALQVIQKDDEIIFLAESDHQIRIVPIGDHLTHPLDILPSWYGDAIAHWEGDTLVIDTVAINDKSQLDPMGTPHSAALHVVEHMHITPVGEIDDEVTLDDPLTFVHPYTYSYHYEQGGRETQAENVGEYACAENNRDGVITPDY